MKYLLITILSIKRESLNLFRKLIKNKADVEPRNVSLLHKITYSRRQIINFLQGFITFSDNKSIEL